MKHNYSISLCTRAMMLLLLVCASAVAFAQDFTQDGVNYYISGNSAFVSNSAEATGDVTILDKITADGTDYPVTWIDQYAFEGCEGITSVTIPNSVNSIYYHAFHNCPNLTTVTIGNGITYIGSDVFYQSTAVTDVYITADPEALTWEEADCDDFKKDGSTIGHVADAAPWVSKFAGIVNLKFRDPSTVPFSWNYNEATHTLTISGTEAMPGGAENLPWGDFNSDITNVIIENGVPNIGREAFLGCRELTSITIPVSVRTIGRHAFDGCYKLPNISIPTSVTTIGSYAFNCCTSFTSIEVPASVTEMEDYVFYYCTSLASVNFNASIDRIPSKTFCCCTDLTSVSISPSVHEIGETAFGGCSSLTSFDIPASVTSIEPHAFSDCNNLVALNATNDNPIYKSFDGALYTSDGKNFFLCPPGKTTCIVADGTTTIEHRAFESCINLTSVTFPNSLTEIQNDAFSGCYALKEIDLPASVNYISSDAFLDCPNMCAINVAKENTTYKSSGGVVYSKDGKTIVRCPEAGPAITITKDIETIADCAFRYCSNLTSLAIPNNVTFIGYSAFRGCTNLTSVTIGSGVTSIKGDAFYNDLKVTDVYMYADPEKLEWIDQDNDEFKEDKATICHVFDADAFKAKWDTGNAETDVRVTFQADLLPQIATTNMSGENLTTYYNGTENVKVPDDVFVFKVALNGSKLSATEVEDRIINAGQGVILKANGGKTVAMATTTETSTADYSDNILEGVDVDTSKPVGYKYFTLAESQADLAFLEISDNILPAHKAFYKTTSSQTVYRFDDATGIVSPLGETEEGAVYNLSGQRLNKVQKGINIVGGKKIIMN